MQIMHNIIQNFHSNHTFHPFAFYFRCHQKQWQSWKWDKLHFWSQHMTFLIRTLWLFCFKKNFHYFKLEESNFCHEKHFFLSWLFFRKCKGKINRFGFFFFFFNKNLMENSIIENHKVIRFWKFDIKALGWMTGKVLSNIIVYILYD